MSTDNHTTTTTTDHPLICIDDFAARATQILSKPVAGYYNSGAGDELTLRDNCEAYRRIRLRPRFLRDVTSVSTHCELLGLRLSMPIAIAPWALQRMAHPDGEVATARAAHRAGTLYTMSTLSTTSIEELAKAVPADTLRWFQLYVYRDRTLSEQLVRRAEAAGFRAIVLTVDAPVFGERRADERNRFTLPDGVRLRNFDGVAKLSQFESDDDGGAVEEEEEEGGSGIAKYVGNQFDPSITWRDVQWLLSFTRLPVLVKGILTAEDAVLAADLGCSGVIVSNHGARQLDTVQASIDALPEIVRAVGDRLPVLMDGGIRNGSDAFKALALGARCVFVGRPVMWGLAVAGQTGVDRVLEILRDDFTRTMQLCGVQSVDQITDAYVLRSGRSKL